MALEVQATGRDDAEQALQRRERYRGLARLRQARAGAALHVALVLRGQAIALRGHRLAQALAVRRQFQDVRVAAVGR